MDYIENLESHYSLINRDNLAKMVADVVLPITDELKKKYEEGNTEQERIHNCYDKWTEEVVRPALTHTGCRVEIPDLLYVNQNWVRDMLLGYGWDSNFITSRSIHDHTRYVELFPASLEKRYPK